jgi:hypothetical protein
MKTDHTEWTQNLWIGVIFFFIVFAIVILIVVLTTNTSSTNLVSHYSSSATAGDFLTLNKTNYTSLDWKNVTSNTNGTANFTKDTNGIMTFDANTGGFINGVEIPGYALILSSDKSGVHSDQNAVIMGVSFQPFSVSSIAGKIYNYMQFRTQNGGCEVGYVSIASESGTSAGIIHSGYGPYNFLSGRSDIFSDNRNNPMTLNESDVSADKAYAEIADSQSQNGFKDRVFRSNFGFCVDLEQGSLFGLPAADSSAFTTAYAGIYDTILYRKAVTGNQNNIEIGTSNVKLYTVTITSDANISISDNLFTSSTLIPWVDTGATKYGSNDWLKTDAEAAKCKGLFFAPNDSAELFVAFVTNSNGTGCIINSVHNTSNNGNNGPVYEYFFGSGLKR